MLKIQTVPSCLFPNLYTLRYVKALLILVKRNNTNTTAFDNDFVYDSEFFNWLKKLFGLNVFTSRSLYINFTPHSP